MHVCVWNCGFGDTGLSSCIVLGVNCLCFNLFFVVQLLYYGDRYTPNSTWAVFGVPISTKAFEIIFM